MVACSWPGNDPLVRQYHDREWCVPNHDDRYLFEMLTLEGAQAGLSLNTVLSMRECYQCAFYNFDLTYCSRLSDGELDQIRENYNVIKDMSKLKSVRNNARAIRKLQLEFGSFSDYLWRHVDFKPRINSWESDLQIPVKNALAEEISDDLMKRGFQYADPVIIYSFSQAMGMVDDHIRSCPYHTLNRKT